MSSVSGNLVAQSLGGDDGNLISETLVDLKVGGELGVVTLDDGFRGSLDGFRTDATLNK